MDAQNQSYRILFFFPIFLACSEEFSLDHIKGGISDPTFFSRRNMIYWRGKKCTALSKLTFREGQFFRNFSTHAHRETLKRVKLGAMEIGLNYKESLHIFLKILFELIFWALTTQGICSCSWSFVSCSVCALHIDSVGMGLPSRFYETWCSPLAKRIVFARTGGGGGEGGTHWPWLAGWQDDGVGRRSRGPQLHNPPPPPAFRRTHRR